jgi:hypothetical protein
VYTYNQDKPLSIWNEGAEIKTRRVRGAITAVRRSILEIARQRRERERERERGETAGCYVDFDKLYTTYKHRHTYLSLAHLSMFASKNRITRRKITGLLVSFTTAKERD